ncbi:hypothetical protein CR513_37785, partial [Mucuna pruriens]
MTRSSFDPLYELDPEIEITLRRLKKARNIVVSNNSNFVSSSDNSSPITNTSNSIEYKQMENNNKRTLKELATPDVVYQPRRPPQTLKGIPCGMFHNEAIRNTRRLHQNEGVPILLGHSCKRLAVLTASSLQHLGRHEVHILGKVLSGIQNHDHHEGNMWDKATFWRNSA